MLVGQLCDDLPPETGTPSSIPGLFILDQQRHRLLKEIVSCDMIMARSTVADRECFEFGFAERTNIF